jgi:DNA-binding transcriptional MerR regulator
MRVICLPGETLRKLVNTARQEVRVSDLSVLIQSGIPDLHVKGRRELVPEKLDVYKEQLMQVHNLVPKAVIMLIYPPLNSTQQTCSIYDDLNALIRSLNTRGTPNTISRIFHMDHEGRFRVEARRLSDGIHPHRNETARMVRRVLNFMDGSEGERRSSISSTVVSTEECAASSQGEKQLLLLEEQRPVKPSTVVSTEECGTSLQEVNQLLQQSGQQTSAAVTVTVEGPETASARVERLLLQKKETLAELKVKYKREKQAIEDNFVVAIQKVLDTRDVGAVRTVSATGDDLAGRSAVSPNDLRSVLTGRIPKGALSDIPPVSMGEPSSLVVVDEWSFGARDVREPVPKRVHFR